MKRVRSLHATLLSGVVVLALGCGGTSLGTPDGSAPSTEQQSASRASGIGVDAAAASGAGDEQAPNGLGGASVDATGAAEDADGAAMPISWAGRVPLEHRASDSACPHGRDGGILGFSCPDAAVPPLPGNPCVVDSDCTAGENGVCLCAPDLMPPPSGSGQGSLYNETFCSYDECFVDSDCGPRVPCECRDPNVFGSPNECLSGSDCALDSDCGPPGFCSLSDRPGQTPSVGYFCHTPNDTCIDDGDCPVVAVAEADCRFDPTTASWRCFQIQHMQ